MTLSKHIALGFLTIFISLLTAIGFKAQVLAFDPFGGSNNTACQQTNAAGQQSPVCSVDGTQNPITGKDGVITNIANIFALLTGIAAVVAILIGGFEYVRSGGESSKINKAKNTIMFAIIGLVIVAVARGIVALVISNL